MWLAQVEMKVGLGYVSRPSPLVCELKEGPLLNSFEHMPEGICARPVRPTESFLARVAFLLAFSLGSVAVLRKLSV